MIRSTLRHAQPICKVEFTKIKKNAFFLTQIRFISQKYIIFASDFEIVRIITIKKFTIMKTNLKFRLHYCNTLTMRIFATWNEA